MKKTGQVKLCWFVTCGNCGKKIVSFDLTKQQVMNNLRAAKWQKTREHGWTCPECIEKLNPTVEVPAATEQA